jgi:hypothetical protein
MYGQIEGTHSKLGKDVRMKLNPRDPSANSFPSTTRVSWTAWSDNKEDKVGVTQAIAEEFKTVADGASVFPNLQVSPTTCWNSEPLTITVVELGPTAEEGETDEMVGHAEVR